MKKCLRTGKKALSVFMAVLMAITAMVFTAPQKASAVDNGKYYVRVHYKQEDGKDTSSETGNKVYKGPWTDKNGTYVVGDEDADIYKNAKRADGYSSTNYPSGEGFTVFYGNDQWNSNTVVNLEEFAKEYAGEKDRWGSDVVECDGFPTKIQFFAKSGDMFKGMSWFITEVEVSASPDMTNPVTIWEGKFGAKSTWSAYIGYIYLENEEAKLMNSKGGVGDGWQITTNKSNWTSPAPSKIEWVDPDKTFLDISSGTSTVSREFTYNILDQYGVALGTTALKDMSITPTVSVTAVNDKGSAVGVGTDNKSDLYRIFTSSSNKIAVYARNTLKSDVPGINNYPVTITVTAGTVTSEAVNFTIRDPKYTVYFNSNDGDTLNPLSTQVFYGESLDTQAAIDGATVGANYPNSGNYPGHSWLGLWTEKNGGDKFDPAKPVEADTTYYAHWDAKTYTVVFLDKDGKYVDVQYVGYGQAANTDRAEGLLPETVADENGHYKFSNWDPNVDAVNNNTITKAVYTMEAHNFGASEPVEANCSHGAGRKQTCTVCGYEKLTVDSTKGNHVPSTELTVLVSATCTTAGKGTHRCTVCGDPTDSVEIPALGHSYKIEVTKEASCTETGVRTLTCTRCGEQKTEEIPQTQHSYVRNAEKSRGANCKTGGYDYMECEVCGAHYLKYIGDATQEHTWSNDYDINTGVLTLTCSVCGLETTVDIGAGLTNYVKAEVTQEPTCEQDGIITITAGDDKTTVTIPKENIPHNYKTKVGKDATCTEDGYYINVCTVCGDKDENNTVKIEKLGHDYQVTTVDATCTTDGTKTTTCSRCELNEVENLPATGHKASDVKINCTSGGNILCAVCGEVVGAVEPKAHDYEDGEVTETPATCTENGIQYTKCKYCDAQKVKLLPLASHDFESSEWKTVVPSTCTAEGVQKRMCSKGCGAFEIQTTKALGHDTETTVTPATCTAAGKEVIDCKRANCDYVVTNVIDPLGHDWNEGVFHKQDCLAGDYTKYTCKRDKCGETRIEFGEHTSGYGHNFSGEETVVKAATCETDGEKTVACVNDGCTATETQVIPKLGHKYVAEGAKVPATCTTGAYTKMVCENSKLDGVVCENPTYNDYDPTDVANGHTWGNWKVTKESTNNEDGEMVRTCTVCGTSDASVTIPKGGHRFENAVGVVIKQATCKEEGLTKYTCTAHKNCGVTITVTTAKAPHTLATKYLAATCEAEGYIKIYCSTCDPNCQSPIQTSTLPAKQHSFGKWTTKKEATCKEEGILIRSCINCGKTEEQSIPKTDHHYKATVKNPTCTDRGFTAYACVGCGAVYYDNYVAALGHDYVKGEYEEATCTTPGRTKYVCKRVNDGVPCDSFYYDEDPNAPATGHKLSDWRFVDHPSPLAPEAYAKWRYCENTGCTYDEYEKGEGESAADGINIYYLVNFYNEWATKEYDVLTQNKVTLNPLTYTKLAKSYKTVNLAQVYVLKGNEAVYPNKLHPVREKDVDWGGYTFKGWTTQKGLDAAGLTDDITGITADLSNIQKNTDVYAFFRCKEVYYGVTFFNGDGKILTVREHILHGHSAEWPDEFGTPTLKENLYYTFKFKNWSYDYTKIYDNVGIYAEYDSIIKTYKLVYRDWDGSILGTENISYGGKAQNVPKVTSRPEDATYIYEFLNKWVDSSGAEVDLNSFTSVKPDAKEGEEINIFAKNSQRMKIYQINLNVVDPYGQTCGGATVQITDSRGQLLASATTDESGHVRLGLTYSPVYGVKINRGNYAIEGTMSMDATRTDVNIRLVYMINTNEYVANIKLNDYTNKDMPSEKCGCICHTVFGGLWITILNLLYRVFKTKHVCCYDMYVVHGDKLLYGAN